MNSSTTDNAVQWLFLDLNAFFASCEQQENPALRGKPVIVVQTPAETAVAIAASCAAKAFGIKTGTLVREARRLCPDVIPVQANTGSTPTITNASSRRSTPACRSRRSCRSTRWPAA
jgi:nucleotidyltransferase/DNA polymerase involved in DNA repair